MNRNFSNRNVLQNLVSERRKSARDANSKITGIDGICKARGYTPNEMMGKLPNR